MMKKFKISRKDILKIYVKLENSQKENFSNIFQIILIIFTNC